MSAATKLEGLAVAAVLAWQSAPLVARAEDQVSDQCVPRTLGHTALSLLSQRLSEGVMTAEYWDQPGGLLLRLDYTDGPPPNGSFIKFPNAWPLKGADSANRIALPRMQKYSDLGWEDTASIGIRTRLHDVQTGAIQLGFNCNPSSYGGQLKDGALNMGVFMRALGHDNLLFALRFTLGISIPQYCPPNIVVPELCVPEFCTPRVCILGHCSKRYCVGGFCTDEYTIELPCTPEISWSGSLTTPDFGIDVTDFLLEANLVPKISVDGASLDLALYTDLTGISSQMGDLVTNSAGALAAAGTGALCTLTPFPLLCIPIAAPIVWVAIQEAGDKWVDPLIEGKLRDIVETSFAGKANQAPYKACGADSVVCTCESTCVTPDPVVVNVNGIALSVPQEPRCEYPAPAPGVAPGNQLLRLVKCKFADRIDSLKLPEKVMSQDVPNFDEVVPFDPPYAPTCQP